jgi:hypothetical protein
MARESRDWSVPSPVRALLWWPAISFVLVIVAPDAAAPLIVAAGAALAALGLLLARMTARLRAAPAVAPATATGTAAAAAEGRVEHPTTEFPTVEFSRVDERRERAA